MSRASFPIIPYVSLPPPPSSPINANAFHSPLHHNPKPVLNIDPFPPAFAMAKTMLLSLSLAFLLLFHVCSADERRTGPRPTRETGRRPTRGTGRQNECEIDRLNTIEPTNQIQCEAGVIETWDHNDEQLQCAGVATIKRTIEPNGLQLPTYQNAPQLVYIIKGRGIQGTAIPGCPETYQSSQQSSEGQQGRRFQDQHQKIRHIREGDIIAIPAGVPHWCYNDGDSPLITISLLDTSNNENQLDYNPRSFYLGGNPEPEYEQQQQGRQPGRQGRQQGQQGGSCNNIFCGLSIDIIAEAFNINEETAKKIQSIDDNRKNIVKIEGGLQVIRPPRSREERGQQEGRGNDNGLEETLCTLRLKENIGDPSRADIYTPQAGRISTLNSLNLPILKWIQLSAERGVLYSNAIMIPHWNVNAHSIIYGLAGRARIQIVDNYGNTVYDGEINENQILVVPQNFAVTKQAENEGFAWISFKTNDIATISTLAGRTSAIRALPQQVIAQAFQISEEDARRIKFNREETHLIQSRQGRRSEGRAEA